jgi:two-component sensor histidine kinase
VAVEAGIWKMPEPAGWKPALRSAASLAAASGFQPPVSKTMRGCGWGAMEPPIHLVRQGRLKHDSVVLLCSNSQMQQFQARSRFLRFIRRGGLWLTVIAVLLLVFSATGWAAKGTPAKVVADPLSEATNHLGLWIWDAKAADKQTCRLWKSFVIPPGTSVTRAILRITVDNGYRLFLDGREIGRGSDWRSITEYDVTWLLSPGRHVLAVEGFNDRLEAGLILGLYIQLLDQRTIEIVSDNTWFIVPNTVAHWEQQKMAPGSWPHATVVGFMHQPPWEIWPFGLSVEPPLRPIIVHFWQTGWFQLTLVTICALAVLFCLWLMTQLTAQSKAQGFLQIERARIARDIHDDLGARLTNLVLLGEVAQSELPADSGTRSQINEICEKARDLSHAMDEVVWAVNSRRDTLRDFATYVCKYAQFFLGSTPIRCRLDVEPEMPPAAFDLPIRRNLFLAVKEALNNAAKHSEASEVFLRLYRHNQKVTVVVEDNGRGFDPAQADAARNGMNNMKQRMDEIGGIFGLASQPGSGCRVEFTVPLSHSSGSSWLARHRRTPAEAERAPAGAETPSSAPAHS